MVAIQITKDAFLKMFDEVLPDCRTKLQAYEKAERLHEIILGDRRYSDFESFKKVLYRTRK